MSNIDTNAAWAKVKDFLSNFRHDCEEETAHIEAKLGFSKPEPVAPVAPEVKAPEPEPTPVVEAPAAPEAPAASV